MVDNNEGGWELVTVVVTDDIGRVDVVVTTKSFALVRIPVPFEIGLVCGFVGGESTCLEFDVLLLVVVVDDVDGTVFCETIAEYWRTGNVVVVVEVVRGYVKCGGALVESTDAEDGADGNIVFDDSTIFGDCCCCWNWEGFFGEDMYVVEELFVPEFNLDKRKVLARSLGGVEIQDLV